MSKKKVKRKCCVCSYLKRKWKRKKKKKKQKMSCLWLNKNGENEKIIKFQGKARPCEWSFKTRFLFLSPTFQMIVWLRMNARFTLWSDLTVLMNWRVLLWPLRHMFFRVSWHGDDRANHRFPLKQSIHWPLPTYNNIQKQNCFNLFFD